MDLVPASWKTADSTVGISSVRPEDEMTVDDVEKTYSDDMYNSDSSSRIMVP